MMLTYETAHCRVVAISGAETANKKWGGLLFRGAVGRDCACDWLRA